MRSLELRLSLLLRLTVLGLCLLLVNDSFSQQRLPVLIPYANDTLVAISKEQFDVVLFSFSYLRMTENTLEITSKELLRSDSINTYLKKVMSLERLKMDEKEIVIHNLEYIIKQQKKAVKREKLKKTFTYLGLGLLAGAEAGIITYLLIR